MKRIAWLSLILATAPAATEIQEGPRPVELSGIENAFQLATNLYSGAQPEGPASFAALRERGVRTVISVDGAVPDVEAARAAGLRYVHLPIGYDGIPADRAAQLVRAVRESPGPVFIHCHHGKHRGPSAAALCARAENHWSAEQARAWLKEAGTSPDYAGLIATVERPLPTPEAVAAVTELPERATVSGLVDSMVAIDKTWDNLKAIERAGWKTPADRPDLDPPHEAIQLVEHFREAMRLEDAKERGEAFLSALAEAEQRASDLNQSLRTTGPDARPAERFRAAGLSCVHCHQRDRDPPR